MLEMAWGWITWSWNDDLCSMRLCVKYEFVVECGVCWKKDVCEYTCDDMYIVWMLWYYENPVIDRW
jgi:hypothetical protein